MQPGQGFLWYERSLGEDVFIRSPAEKKDLDARSQAYASFGDDGTTVSLSAYGHILQISRYLGYGSSGMFCVDLQYSKPWYVQSRMEDIMSSATDPEKGLRLDLLDWTTIDERPSLGFMFDRWPRYVFKQRPQDEGPAFSEDAPRQEAQEADRTEQGGGPNNLGTEANEDQETAEGESTTTLSKAFLLSVQYFCYKGTVVQSYFIPSSEVSNQAFDKAINLDTMLSIRSLDFVSNQDFDTTGESSETLKTFVLSNKHLVITRTIPKYVLEQGNPSPLPSDGKYLPVAVALVISPFINGEPATIDTEHCVTFKREDAPSHCEITVAYKLSLLQEADMSFLISTQAGGAADLRGLPSLANVENSATKQDTVSHGCNSEAKDALDYFGKEFVRDSLYHKIFFSPDPFLDFALRRNLEHTLSVCSLPTFGGAVAITCGDISGHRVGPRASLSAIQFLSSMLKYLDPDDGKSKELRLKNRKANILLSKKSDGSKGSKGGKDLPKEGETGKPHLIATFERVREVLKGHLTWICEKAAMEEGEIFAPHYWPSGRRIDEPDGSEYLPPPSLIDTPLQLMKVLHCLEAFPNQGTYPDVLLSIEGKFNSKVDNWTNQLHTLNTRGTYAFPRLYKNGDIYESYEEVPGGAKYSLTDHVMIGMALKFVGLLNLSTSNQSRPYYSYEEVRAKTLKRFTTENPMSKQRTIATSRWAHKTRFLLHSKDTFLFTNNSLDFFNDPKRDSLASTRKRKGLTQDESTVAGRFADQRWVRLLEAQAYHDEFQVLDWDEPLWYVLVVVLGFKGVRLNQQPAEALALEIRTKLLGRSAYNGLFPGLFGQKMEPVVYESETNRDSYWFSTFEIPHMLWIHGAANDFTTTFKQSQSASPDAAAQLNTYKDSVRIGKQVGKYVSFTNIGSSKDQLGLDVLSDDWLQSPSTVLNCDSVCENRLQLDKSAFSNHQNRRDPVKTLDEVVMEFPIRSDSEFIGTVIDVPKWSLGTEITGALLTVEEACKALGTRSVWMSKKRIVWLPYSDRTVVGKCHSASSATEKDDILSFLARHIKSEKYFFDSATAARNEWETELHLSFFHMSDSKDESLHEFEGGKYLASTVMSFRFFGDFSDRFWTCHFLENGLPKDSHINLALRLLPSKRCGIRDGLDMLRPHEELEPEERRKARGNVTKPWQQRRILELLIYSKMLEQLLQDRTEIFRVVRGRALRLDANEDTGPNSDPFKRAIDEASQLQKLANEDDYFSVALQWSRYGQILLVVEDNLSDNIEKIREWSRRENDRKSQQPRWTKGDEEKHRTTILKLDVFTQRQAREVERLKNQIEAFRESLPTQLASIRDDISFRGSQNINLFTYVTIVFLPLGFATGLFSMSGAPEHSVLMDLITLAIGAFGITLFALLNAKTFRTLLPFLLQLPPRLLRYTFFHTVVAPTISRLVQRAKLRKATNLPPSLFLSAFVSSVATVPSLAHVHWGPDWTNSYLRAYTIEELRDMSRGRNFRTYLKELLHMYPRYYSEIMMFSFWKAAKEEKRKEDEAPMPKRSGENGLKGAPFQHQRMKLLNRKRHRRPDPEQGQES
ncbi:uncharacterized protein CC84DRAFT_1210811 [Paraphaeosphaeria sporulosa]|uniref:Uncharacterized protein n=1 Tax=Paraphaeosphaeria sporulosa TaxID=1460663 RepID=A0A177CUB3_9PLEO|nr:uncharacterized protein CC84DRAFT_1210811 [Paraphaeosphaeria sporulosa]OAG11135.1 hypothetical protein CC84DRAFT_1210811 [Paraphaeosphaeria sporulosa]